MNESIEIYKKKLRINKERKQLLKQIKSLEKDLINLQNECNHQIVLEFDDHEPHKIGRIIDCVCPACGKRESLYYGHDIENSAFKDSKLIDLTKFPTSTFNDYISSIVELIIDNYNNEDILENELTESIYDLVDVQESEEKTKTLNRNNLNI